MFLTGTWPALQEGVTHRLARPAHIQSSQRLGRSAEPPVVGVLGSLGGLTDHEGQHSEGAPRAPPGRKGPGKELGYCCCCKGGSSLPFQPIPAVVPQPTGVESSIFTSVVQLVPMQWSLELVPVTPVVS